LFAVRNLLVKMGQELAAGKDLVAVCVEHLRFLLPATWGAG